MFSAKGSNNENLRTSNFCYPLRAYSTGYNSNCEIYWLQQFQPSF